MYKTYQEICGQYDAIQKTVEYMKGKKEEILDFFQKEPSKSFVFLGCGSSYFLSQSGELMAKMKLGVKASSLSGGDLMMNCESYANLVKDSVVVAISRSGMTSEILNSISQVKKTGNIPVVAICCANDTKLSQAADLSLEIPWAFDNSVCQTRSVSNLYAVLSLLTSFLADDRETVSEIETVGTIGGQFMKENESALKNIAQKAWDNVIVLADVEIQGLAMEAALAFKEISNVISNYYHVLDVRHGPIVLANSRTLFVMRLLSRGMEYEKQLVADAAKTGSTIVTLTDKGAGPFPDVGLNISIKEKLGPEASGLLFIYLAQILSYYKALQKGLNPDTPHNLDAWIKL